MDENEQKKLSQGFEYFLERVTIQDLTEHNTDREARRRKCQDETTLRPNEKKLD